MNRKEYLSQSYPLFEKIISGQGKLELNRKINFIVKNLMTEHGLERQEIHNQVIAGFLSKNTIEKYCPNNALSTFILWASYYELEDINRTLKARIRYYPLNQLEEIAVDYRTPESLIIAKELIEFIYEHLGTEDAEVLLGYEDRFTAAAKMNMKYGSYSKRLWRKKIMFRPLVLKAGYNLDGCKH